jgi:hypothetical protein
LARSRVPVAVAARRKTARDKRECLVRHRDQKTTAAVAMAGGDIYQDNTTVVVRVKGS